MVYPISAAYVEALQSSVQNITSLAVVLSGGTPVDSVPPLDVTQGLITYDSGQSFMGQMAITCVDPTGEFTPTQASGAANVLAPYGDEIAVYRGLAGFPLIPLGVFRITQAVVTDTATSFSIAVSGYDRSYTVAQQKWSDVYSIVSGTNVDAAIEAIISPRFPFGINYNFLGSLNTSPLVTYGLTSNTDPWAACTALATINGNYLNWDALGNCQQIPVPIPGATQSVFNFIEGPTNTIIELDTYWVTENIPNDVIVVGQGSGIAAGVQAQAQVTNPNNPMAVSGDYGDCPTITNSPLATTNAIALVMAQAQLQAGVGTTQAVQVQCIPAPHLQLFDTVYIQRDRSGVAAPYIINHVECPMEPGTLMRINGQLSASLA